MASEVALVTDLHPFTYLGAVRGYERTARGVELACGEARVRLTVVSLQIVQVRVAYDGAWRPRRSWAPGRAPEEWPTTPFAITEDDDAIWLAVGDFRVSVQRRSARIACSDERGRVFAEDVPEGAVGWRAPDRVGAPGTWAGETVWRSGVVCRKRMPVGERYYGFGERVGMLEKSGARYTNWTTDTWNHSPATDAMYQAIPFFLAIRPDARDADVAGSPHASATLASGQAGDALAYGISFDTPFRSALDMGRTEPGIYRLEATEGELVYDVIYGPTPADVTRAYTELVGRMPLPPRWALGYHQSRWGYDSEHAVRTLAAAFRGRALPADVIHLVIDYMDGYRDFTWDTTRFPDPAGLLADLRAEGFRIVTVIDSGIKREPGAAFFEEGVADAHFLRNADGALSTANVWPGECVFPDFTQAATRAWWGEHHRALLAAGVAGIWNDMNEPSDNSSPIPLDAPVGRSEESASEQAEPPATFAEARNLYGLLEARATYEGLRRLRPDERPFLLTRSGYAGIQQYSAVWTGDNISAWEHLEMALPQLMNLGLSGVAFCGTDIGGFWHDATPELYARWMQLGAFSPFARGHSVRDSRPHEPWAFGLEVEGIARRYLELRYRLLPYLYTCFHYAATTGAPVLRPLVYAYPADAAVAALHDQALFGSDLLLAPVYRPGVTQRLVYLPAGIWHDYWTGARISGGQHIVAEAPLGTLPLYVRGGSIIPSGPTMQWSGERPLDPLTLDIYAGNLPTATGSLYDDDGATYAYERGDARLTMYRYQRSGDVAALRATSSGGLAPPPRRTILRFHGTQVRAAQWLASAPPLAVSADEGTPDVVRVELPAEATTGDWVVTLELAAH